MRARTPAARWRRAALCTGAAAAPCGCLLGQCDMRQEPAEDINRSHDADGDVEVVEDENAAAGGRENRKERDRPGAIARRHGERCRAVRCVHAGRSAAPYRCTAVDAILAMRVPNESPRFRLMAGWRSCVRGAANIDKAAGDPARGERRDPRGGNAGTRACRAPCQTGREHG